MNTRKISVARKYDEAFGDCRQITLLKTGGYRNIGLFVYIVRINKGRNELMDHLTRNGVGSGIHYIPSHLFTFYKKEKNHLPVTEQIYDEILTLPLFPDITDAQAEHVIETVLSGITPH